MSQVVSIEEWPGIIEPVLEGECRLLKRLVLLRQTASTQDAARASGAPAGTVVAAWRQTNGRGRLGRAWLDTGEEGVAVTFVVPGGTPERLAMVSAVAAAEAMSRLGGAAAEVVGIKWPNDLVAHERKLAGILVEQIAGASEGEGTGRRAAPLALIGVGVNVGQRAFPPPMDARATSLALLGMHVDRVQVVCALARALDTWLEAPEDVVYRTYRARDRFTGRTAHFQTAQGRVHGRVINVDPMRGLHVATEQGERFLAAATTSVLPEGP